MAGIQRNAAIPNDTAVGLSEEDQWAVGIIEQPCTEESRRNLQKSFNDFFAKATAQEQQALDEARNLFYQTAQSAQNSQDLRYPDRTPGLKKTISQRFRAGWNKSSEVAFQYTQHLDVMVGQAPEYVGLAYGAIKLVLIVQINHEELKQGVRKHLKQIQDDFSPIDTITCFVPTGKMFTAVAEAYSHFLRFLDTALKYYAIERWKLPFKAFASPWKTEFQGIVNDIQQSIAQVQKLALVHGLAVSHQNLVVSGKTLQAGEEALKMGEQTNMRMSNIEKSLGSIESMIRTLQQWPSIAFQNEEEIKQTRDMLQQRVDENQDLPFQLQSAPSGAGNMPLDTVLNGTAKHEHSVQINNHETLYQFRDTVFPDLRELEETLHESEILTEQLPEMESYRQKKHSLLKLERVMTWLESDRSELLWVNGNHVLRRSDWNTSFALPLLIDGRERYPSVIILRYFCEDLGSSRKNNCRTLMQALIFEVLEKHPGILTDQGLAFTKERFTNASKSVSKLWALFFDCLLEVQSQCTFIIIDSIDHLQPTMTEDGAQDSKTLVEELNKLVKENRMLVKVLLTARLAQSTTAVSSGADAALIAPQRKLSLDIVQDQLPMLDYKLAEIQEGRCKSVTFAELYLLYPVRTTIYTLEDGCLRAFVVAELSGMEQQQVGRFSPLRIRAWYIDHDGQYFARQYSDFSITMFGGSRPVASLRYIPAGYLPGETKSRANLIARGHTFWIWGQGTHLKEYKGNTVIKKPGRVMVDQQQRPSKLRGSNDIENQVTSKTGIDLKPLMFLVCPPTVTVYDLQDLKWIEVKLEELSEPHFDESSVRRLVLPKKIKTLILASVKSFVDQDTTSRRLRGTEASAEYQFDLTHRRGTCAEAVTRPLMTIDAGIISSNVQETEETVETVFDYAQHWNAVIHITDADVLLVQSGTKDDLEQRRITSMFRRKLKHFKGVCFLTTSRIGLFSAPFISSMDLVLYIPYLDMPGRVKVWKLTLERLGIPLTDENSHMIESELCKPDLSACQIGSCVTTAQALARSEHALAVGSVHLSWALEMSINFNRYHKDVQRADQPLENVNSSSLQFWKDTPGKSEESATVSDSD